MMNKSVQRSGERVTAEEIRTMISDIDDVLGGVYSLLAQELQLPLVVRIMDRMVREKKIVDVQSIKGQDGKPVASPKVVTGIEALGRGHDFNKYMTAMREIVVPLKELLIPEMNIKDFAERAFVSLSIDVDGIFKSDEQKAQDQQKLMQAQQGQMMGEMLQSAVKGGVPPLAKAAADRMIPAQEQEGIA
jgi:hypothetical protein